MGDDRRLTGLPGRRAALLALAGLAACSPGCAWIDLRQRLAVFRPERRVPEGFTGLVPPERSWLEPVPAEEGGIEQLALWWLPHADPDAPSLLYLHGTFRNLFRNRPKIEALRAAGFSVLAVDYRGWGQSSPRVPSEASIYADARTAWRALLAIRPDPARCAVFGHSMGGGVAVELATELARAGGPQPGALILESTFTSFPDVAREARAWGTPLAWFATQRFASIDKIAAVRSPILVMHGERDDTVAYVLGRRLFDAAPEPKRFVGFPTGGHSELHDDDPARYAQAVGEVARRLRAAR